MDTVGGLIDKLFTVDQKMWVTQDDFYKLRKLTQEEFLEIYKDPEKLKELYSLFKKGIDLNLQRNVIIDEIDTLLVEMTGVPDDGRYLQRKNKTYV